MRQICFVDINLSFVSFSLSDGYSNAILPWKGSAIFFILFKFPIEEENNCAWSIILVILIFDYSQVSHLKRFVEFLVSLFQLFIQRCYQISYYQISYKHPVYFRTHRAFTMWHF